MEKLDWISEARRRAARKAIEHVKDGFIVGLGSGRTVEIAIMELGALVKSGKLKIKAVPSSFRTATLAIRSGIQLISLEEADRIDIAIDGADQADASLNLIKGRGGCLAREKIIDSIAKELIIIIDETKLTDKLGSNIAIPIEVLPFATFPVMKKLRELGGKPKLREYAEKLGPVVTENGNFIIDVDFGVIDEPSILNEKLKLIPGVVETGLFVNMADVIYVGLKEGLKVLSRNRI